MTGIKANASRITYYAVVTILSIGLLGSIAEVCTAIGFGFFCSIRLTVLTGLSASTALLAIACLIIAVFKVSARIELGLVISLFILNSALTVLATSFGTVAYYVVLPWTCEIFIIFAFINVIYTEEDEAGDLPSKTPILPQTNTTDTVVTSV